MKNPVRHQTSGSAQLSRGPNSIRVTAPARLHLGFLDLNGALGRRFGSIGMAVDQPTTNLVIRRAKSNSAHGPEAERVLSLLQKFSRSNDGAFYDVTIGQAIPAHAGL